MHLLQNRRCHISESLYKVSNKIIIESATKSNADSYLENHVGTLTKSRIVRRVDGSLLGETGIKLGHVVGTSLNMWEIA